MRQALYYLPALLLAIAIAWASLWDNSSMLPISVGNDKLVHVLMYAGLSLSLMIGLGAKGYDRWGSNFLVWGVASLYGGVLELLQVYCTVSRTGDWLDWLCDVVGAVVGIGLLRLIVICKRKYYIK